MKKLEGAISMRIDPNNKNKMEINVQLRGFESKEASRRFAKQRLNLCLDGNDLYLVSGDGIIPLILDNTMEFDKDIKPDGYAVIDFFSVKKEIE